MKYTTVSIPRPLNDKIKKFIKKTGFASTSAFVTFILREILLEKKGKPSGLGEEKIKEHLKALGYL